MDPLTDMISELRGTGATIPPPYRSLSVSPLNVRWGKTGDYWGNGGGTDLIYEFCSISNGEGHERFKRLTYPFGEICCEKELQ